jgi:3-oxoacyl-(acyl-carrier-protein) synthase
MQQNKIKESDIAVVGMSCIFPGAGDLYTYWDNIINKVDAIKEAPENRIAKVFYNPSSTDVDRLYCNRGGFIDEYLDFNPLDFGIVPNTIKGTEPDHLLSIKLTHKALEDAGYFEKKIPLEKTGIIIGKGNFGGLELWKVLESMIGGENFVNLLKVVMPSLSNDELYNVKKKFQEQYCNFGPHNVMGTIPNLVASLVANRFNFGGPAYTIDAACASSLIAINNSINELLTNRCDTMIAGAMHLGQNPVLWSMFTQLGALSKSQIIRPFDKKADGVLAGEGCGFVVLRKLKDAIKDDQRIYAIIKGVGVSSDGSYASPISPAWQGQIKAIKGAWEKTSFHFDQIGYIEAHGTATLVGDKTELQTLKEAFPYNHKLPKAGIGSIKSMIGHAMPAAGMAGFIKTVMAVYKGILPPTLNCDDPIDALFETRFIPVQEAIDWGQTDLPFIAGISAFGFGGANAHTVIEKFNAENKYEKKYNIPFEYKAEDKLLLLARSSKEELLRAIESGDKSIGDGKYRLALFNPDEKRIALAIRIINKDKPWRNKQDLWFTNEPLLVNEGKVAFMFPGLDMNSLQNLNSEKDSNSSNQSMVTSFNKYDHKEGHRLFLGFEEACKTIYDSLKGLNVFPDVVAGHSVGEWVACSILGIISDENAIEELNKKAQNRSYTEQNIVYLGVNCSASDIKDLLNKEPDVYLSIDNCPLQITLSLKHENIERIRECLSQRGITSHILPFNTGYHSPFLKQLQEEVTQDLESIHFNIPEIPFWSCITAASYPKAIEEIRKLQVDFITQPVLFRQLVENLYQDGVRMFIQIGIGSLPGFINDTLKNKNHTTITAGSIRKDLNTQLKRVLAALFVEGKKVNTQFLGLDQAASNTIKKKKNNLTIRLDLSLPFINYNNIFSDSDLIKTQLTEPLKNAKINHSSNTILDSYYQNINAIAQSQDMVLGILSSQKTLPDILVSSDPVVSVKKEQNNKRIDIKKNLEISLAKYPELKDHCPFRKRSITDNFVEENEPVVPFTMFIDLFIRLLKDYYPKIEIVKIVNAKVYQFLWVKKINSVEVIGKWIDYNTIQFEIENYVKLSIIVDKEVCVDDSQSFEIKDSFDAPIDADDIYKEGYMFHGPSFQGIKKIKSYGNNGIITEISGLKGMGATLDNVGQSNALFYHLSGVNIMSFPVAIQEIQFYQDPLEQAGIFDCTNIFMREDEEFLYSNIELKKDGKKWCLFKGWQNRKSELDDAVWKIINRAEGRSLSKQMIKGVSLMTRKYDRINTWFIILSHYLNICEIEYYNSLSFTKQKE